MRTVRDAVKNLTVSVIVYLKVFFFSVEITRSVIRRLVSLKTRIRFTVIYRFRQKRLTRDS